jgi:UPF0716 protein FxsA
MTQFRRVVPWWVLALLFVVLPMAEIYVLIQVGQVIGALWTVLLLIAAGFLGSFLLKHEGSRAWRALREALAEHRMPARELADGALIVFGGTLLLTPGFLSDAVGLFCVLPVTRPLARRVLTRVLSRKLLAGAGSPFQTYASYGHSGPHDPRARRRPGTDDDSVVRGEVVD